LLELAAVSPEVRGPAKTLSRAAALLAAALVVAAGGGSADAHGGDPRFESKVTAVTPAPFGLTAAIPGGGTHLQVANRTGKSVEVGGYDGEVFARILADGKVQSNRHSPAWYLNKDAMGNVTVPAAASAKAQPLWVTEDSTGTWQWHDHRVHWMGIGVPAQVHDTAKRTLISNWTVPLKVGGRPVTVHGQLWWVGQQEGFPVAALVGFGVLALLAVLLVAVVIWRRRNSTQTPS